MPIVQRLSKATPDSIRAELLLAVNYLLFCVRRHVAITDEVEQVRGLLDSLPLTTDTYGVAANRLANAHRYLLSQEPGAAGYELQLLARGLQNRREAIKAAGGLSGTPV